MNIHATYEPGEPILAEYDPLRRGLECSAGRAGRVDLIQAHKWFNIAAARGDKSAARLREEVASEMSRADIAEALRAAREWLSKH